MATAAGLRDAGDYIIGPKGEHIFDTSQCDADTLRWLALKEARGEAQDAGYTAGEDRTKVEDDNPFPPDSAEYRCWRLGFRGCRQDLRNPPG